jgi:hypothetical protein
MDLEETEARIDCAGKSDRLWVNLARELAADGSTSMKAAVRVRGSREIVATLQRREQGSSGSFSVGSRYQAMELRTLVLCDSDLWS